MRILVKGGGDLATGVAYELHLVGHDVLVTELPEPLSVRRAVCFSRAVYEGRAEVENAVAVLTENQDDINEAFRNGFIPVAVDPNVRLLESFRPDVLVDGIMAKKNTGTHMEDAPFVVALGPGFEAGKDCDCVIETQRGPTLGNPIWDGCALPNTGIPGNVGGATTARLLRASASGAMESVRSIGDMVKEGEIVAYTDGVAVHAQLSGVIRGLIQDGAVVSKGLKIGDVDPRCDRDLCFQISDKARKIGRGCKRAIESRTLS